MSGHDVNLDVKYSEVYRQLEHKNTSVVIFNAPG